MPDILHKVDVGSSSNETYRALTTLEGLSGWWTKTTQGNPNVGGTIAFRFGPLGGFDMKVLELEPDR
ncbi:MAG TPA: SRPBCC domain-containing protein, partial [Myxococcaceae bacterium]|nr:SRPBCC domain-containing protein [Myxococcaceae bacterium]